MSAAKRLPNAPTPMEEMEEADQIERWLAGRAITFPRDIATLGIDPTGIVDPVCRVLLESLDEHIDAPKTDLLAIARRRIKITDGTYELLRDEGMRRPTSPSELAFKYGRLREIRRDEDVAEATYKLRTAHRRGDSEQVHTLLSQIATLTSDETPSEVAFDWRPIKALGPWFTTEPPPRKWILTRDGAGALAIAIVGMLVAPGGRGKTYLALQLALSVATGRRWLEHFEVAEPGRVLVALAEEDDGEIQRRLYQIGCGLGLSDEEIADASERIFPLGLKGKDVKIVESDAAGNVRRTRLHEKLLKSVAEHKPSLVILDPLSRWAPKAEKENDVATASIQAFEALTDVPGKPAVLLVHHTNKQSRREGNRDEDASGARGVSALTDAVRFVGTITGMTEKDIAFAVKKSNYSRKGEPVYLRRDEANGTLRPPTSAEIDFERASKSRDLRTSIKAAIAAEPGIGKSDLRREVGGNATRVDAEVRAMVSEGTIVDRKQGNAHHYHLADPADDGTEPL